MRWGGVWYSGPHEHCWLMGISGVKQSIYYASHYTRPLQDECIDQPCLAYVGYSIIMSNAMIDPGITILQCKVLLVFLVMVQKSVCSESKWFDSFEVFDPPLVIRSCCQKYITVLYIFLSSHPNRLYVLLLFSWAECLCVDWSPRRTYSHSSCTYLQASKKCYAIRDPKHKIVDHRFWQQRAMGKSNYRMVFQVSIKFSSSRTREYTAASNGFR